MAVKLWRQGPLILAVLTICAAVGYSSQPSPAAAAEAKAIRYLMREVPAWSKSNGCFSCHNNGDAARALYAAARAGYSIPPAALADTTAWVSRPERWEQNKGDPGFSDKRLADVQFAASLLAAVEAGQVKEWQALWQAARKLAAGQGTDGAWHIDSGNTAGSPATYGTPLATYMALKTLRQANLPELGGAVSAAERWLRQAPANSTLAAAVLLLAAESEAGASAQQRRERHLGLIRAAQTRDGGWGPYADSPPEPFDTAVVLLALSPLRQKTGVADLIRRGRSFLMAQQLDEGSWPETTRPPGGESYAQRLSTTGWVTLALLATRE